MGKAKRGGNRKAPNQSVNKDDDALSFQKFHRNSVYEPSGSEDEYTEQEKLLLENVHSKARKSVQKKHAIMDLPSEDDDDDDSNNMFNASNSKSFQGDSDEDMDSDIEGKDADEFGSLPDQRAWGKSRKSFYSTDYVDEDYGGFEGDDAEAAQLEEEEAREIQQRLAAELDDTDFTLDVFAKEDIEEPRSKHAAELIKTDLSQLSSRQKLSLLQKEAPELIGIVAEFRDVMSNIIKKLGPAMQLIQEGKVASADLVHYIRTKYHLANNYAMNMGFYLLLRARRMPVAGHPVVKRLLQYRQLLLKLEPLENVASAMLDELFNAASNTERSLFQGNQANNKKPAKPRLNILSSLKTSKDDKKQVGGGEVNHSKEAEEIESEFNGQLLSENNYDTKEKLVKTSKTPKTMPWQNDSDEEDNEGVPWKNQFEEDESKISENMEVKDEGDAKRAITWEMAKNKGLTARRKKEDRNPRVKHRNKFRKAKIRRKGQVREPRTELQRYGGEMSGIKATVSKSIKLK